MPYDPNDPRLTAYALGELDPAEHAMFEAELADAPEAQVDLDEIRATAHLLTEQLRHEPSPGLGANQRLAIEGRLREPTFVFPRRWLGYAAAAGLLGVSLTFALRPRPPEPTKDVTIAQHVHFGRPAPVQALGAPGDASQTAEAPAPASRPDAAGSEKALEAFSLAPSTPAGPAGATAAPAGAPVLPPAAPESRDYAYYEQTPPAPSTVTAGKPAQNAATLGFGANPQGLPLAGRAAARMGGTGGGGGAMGGMLSQGQQGGDTQLRRRDANSPASLSDAQAPRPRGMVAQKEQKTDLPQRELTEESLGRNQANQVGAVVLQKDRGRGSVPSDSTSPVRKKQTNGIEAAPATSAPLAAAGLDAEHLNKEVDKTPALRAPEAESPLDSSRDPVQKLAEAKPGAMNEGLTDQLAERKEALEREAFPEIVENRFNLVKDEPLSTFSIDVDTASYANVRRYLTQHNAWPPKDAVRVEEMVNYFRYNDTEPVGNDPFSLNVELARCPWNAEHRLARIGLKGKTVSYDQRSASNLVFLIDVSGSMQDANKLPLLKSALENLVEALGEKDRIAIVVYAATEGLVLPSTTAYRKGEILSALEQLQAGGSTNGGAGIKLAYDVASDPRNFIKDGINRVILCTDGDLNVGITSNGDLIRLMEEKRKSKVFLTVLGFGEENLQDTKLKDLAKNGNGNYHYIDSITEARKVLIEEGGSTLVTIAQDVKIQVEFNPAKVGAFRQIGYELRQLAHADFHDDTKDAGEIGAGHSVTALYEIVPAGREQALAVAPVDDLVFQRKAPVDTELSKLSFLVKVKYKRPTADKSEAELRRGVEDTGRDYAQASDDFKFAAAVSSFGLVLRDSKYKGNATLAAVEELAKASLGTNPSSVRSEFLDLVRKAREVAKR
jgi:Ca-activated chloride channel family protein